MKTKTWKTGWIFTKTHTKQVFSHMKHTYKDCDAARKEFEAANNNKW